MRKDKAVLVVGLGEIGISVLSMLSLNGWEFDDDNDLTLYGYDIDPEVRKRHKADDWIGREVYISDDLMKVARKSDVICICTPCNNCSEPVHGILNLFMGLENRPLVSVESTLPSHSKIKGYLDKYIDLIIFPHRIAPYDKDHYEADSMVRVMGGQTQQALNRGMRFWSQFCEIKPCSFEEAVLCKVFENAMRFVNIAMAEQIAMASPDPWRMRELINSKWNMKMMRPLEGINRHCLPKDTWFADALVKGDNSLFRTAIRVDEDYVKYIGENSANE